MYKLAIAALLAGSAAAFAPAQVAKSTTALNAFESELGAQVSPKQWLEYIIASNDI